MYNMNEIVGSHDIVFIVLDTLRYDIAEKELKNGNLKILKNYITKWEKRYTPGNFTYPAHHAFFTGFLPTPVNKSKDHNRLFAVSFPGRDDVGKNTYMFKTKDIVTGFKSIGYKTLCIGGVGFFNKMTPLGSELPLLFEESYWKENTGVTNPDSAKHQIEYAVKKIQTYPGEKKIFLFINISAIHQPNYFYDKSIKNKIDTKKSHGAALRYVDSQLASLFDFIKTRNDTFYIICSDHGTLYGENNIYGHRTGHKIVWTVPYSEFIIPKENK